MSTYKDAGVDIDAGNRAVELIKPLAQTTQGPQVLAGVGPFSGLFALDTKRYREPVLVASADGVGTKVLIAAGAQRHFQVGLDLVNHCVNDVATTGAEPLFFLDYVASGVLEPPVIRELIAGMAQACRDSGCALLGGETAEMPGMYGAHVYDVAGFMVGVVERDRLLGSIPIEEGDALMAFPSKGLHTNGYSLARKVIPSRALTQPLEPGKTVLDALLEGHPSYLKEIRKLCKTVRVKALAHITGGGVIDNLPRVLPEALGARIERGTWPEPAIFSYLAPFIPDEEMWRTFNMGLGMIAVVDRNQALDALRVLDGEIFGVGEVVRYSDRRVTIVE
jgi:phosphoribosylformylglycinamidine cyclo-ligase